jgi:hypothetical protein
MDKSKPVKQEVNGTVILPPLVFPGRAFPAKGTLYYKKFYGHKYYRIVISVYHFNSIY